MIALMHMVPGLNHQKYIGARDCVYCDKSKNIVLMVLTTRDSGSFVSCFMLAVF